MMIRLLVLFLLAAPLAAQEGASPADPLRAFVEGWSARPATERAAALDALWKTARPDEGLGAALAELLAADSQDPALARFVAAALRSPRAERRAVGQRAVARAGGSFLAGRREEALRGERDAAVWAAWAAGARVRRVEDAELLALVDAGRESSDLLGVLGAALEDQARLRQRRVQRLVYYATPAAAARAGDEYGLLLGRLRAERGALDVGFATLVAVVRKRGASLELRGDDRTLASWELPDSAVASPTTLLFPEDVPARGEVDLHVRGAERGEVEIRGGAACRGASSPPRRPPAPRSARRRRPSFRPVGRKGKDWTLAADGVRARGDELAIDLELDSDRYRELRIEHGVDGTENGVWEIHVGELPPLRVVSQALPRLARLALPPGTLREGVNRVTLRRVSGAALALDGILLVP
ncbi:MAG: hypothetical protein R3F20_11090 [Planctomycetota bacterium]